MNKTVSQEPDLLGAVVTDAQRVVNSAERYVAAAQALKDYITSLVAGPCPRVPRVGTFRQTDTKCVANFGGKVRPSPSLEPKPIELSAGTEVTFYGKWSNSGETEEGSSESRVWYFGEITDPYSPEKGKYIWRASDNFHDILPLCVASLPEVPADFDPSKTEQNFASIDCSGVSPTGCVEIRDVTFLYGGLHVRTHPSDSSGTSGRVMGTVDIRSVWRYSAIRADIEGCWYLLSPPNANIQLWVKNRAGGIQNLRRLDDCASANSLNFDPTNPNSNVPPGFNYGLGEPVLPQSGNADAANCSTEIPGWPNGFTLYNSVPSDDFNKIKFILNCEAGGDPTQAVNIAQVIRNRMIVGGITARQVIESSEWDCYICGSSTPDRNDPTIQQLAQDLVTLSNSATRAQSAIPFLSVPTTAPSGSKIEGIETALFSVGISFPKFDSTTSVDQILGGVIDFYVRQGICSTVSMSAQKDLQKIYVGARGPNSVGNITVFFTTSAELAICG